MYCKYISTSGTITLSQVQDDIIGLMTGTITTAGGLSASANTGACEVVTTVSGGWTVHDADAGTAANGVTPKVLKAPYSDDGTKYKYLMIRSTAAAELAFEGYETWDAGTNTGTSRSHTAVSAQWGTFSFTVGQNTIISSSSTEFFICTYISASSGGVVWACEFERDDPWNTVSNGYPPWFLLGARYVASANATHNNAVILRAPFAAGNADVSPLTLTNTNTSPRMGIHAYGDGNPTFTGYSSIAVATSAPGGTILDSSKANVASIRELRISSRTAFAGNARHMIGGKLKSAVRAHSVSSYLWWDTITVGADVYVMFYDSMSNGTYLAACVKRV